jgi:hypothetical protein
MIECSNGNVDIVRNLASKVEQAGQELPLQYMMVIALAFKHVDVAKFCIQKGVLIDGHVELAAMLALDKEIFELLFPLNVFSWQQHREYLDELLLDCFDRWPDDGVSVVAESEVKNLAEFLFEQGAKALELTVIRIQDRWLGLMPLLLSHLSEDDIKAGILERDMLSFISNQPTNLREMDRLLTHSPDAAAQAQQWVTFAKNVETLKLLITHGACVDDPRLLIHFAMGGSVDLIEYLLDNGVDVNSLDTGGGFGRGEDRDPTVRQLRLCAALCCLHGPGGSSAITP